jgi:hypothetical protein
MSISRCSGLPATALILELVACGRPISPVTTSPGATPATRVLPAERYYVLEMTGVPPEDTVVTISTRSARTIVLRHGPPDNTVFAELTYPEGAFGGSAAPDSVTVTVHPRPGVYGVDITSPVPPGPGALLRFKYPIHFAAPVAALAQYGSSARLEQALSIGLRREDGSCALLPSDRPAYDNLEAPLGATGTYLVVAPK